MYKGSTKAEKKIQYKIKFNPQWGFNKVTLKILVYALDLIPTYEGLMIINQTLAQLEKI